MRTCIRPILPALLTALLSLTALAATAARADSDPGAEAKASYKIETGDSTRELKVGEKGQAVVYIHPKEKVHVHPQAPLKITVASTPGLKVDKTELGHADAVDPKAEGPRFVVPITATAAGKQDVKANLDFFICSDTWCVKQTQAVSIPVNVK